MIGGDETHKEKARKLMTKIVYSLSGKMEWGSPIGSMYLLGNPDHYTNYMFTLFYWKSFVQEARKPWETLSTPQHDLDSSTANPDPTMLIERDGAGQPRKKIAIFK